MVAAAALREFLATYTHSRVITANRRACPRFVFAVQVFNFTNSLISVGIRRRDASVDRQVATHDRAIKNAVLFLYNKVDLSRNQGEAR